MSVPRRWDAGPWLMEHVDVRLQVVKAGRSKVRMVRDDLLHPWAGGNKLRKLDGYLAELKASGVSDVVTCGGIQSSHAAAVGALCSENGMRAHLMLRGEMPEAPTGYTLLSRLFAHVELVDRDTYADRDFMETYASGLDGAAQVAIIPEGASDPRAMRGLIRLVEGIARKVDDPWSTRTELVVDCGTGTTAAGMALAIALLKLPWTVAGVTLMPDRQATYRRDVESLWARWGESFEAPDRQPEVIWCERSSPRRFGRVLDGEMERCASLARETGVIFDPIYTLAAWDYVEGLRRGERKRSILVHTGGGMNLFGLVQRFGSAPGATHIDDATDESDVTSD